MTAAGVASALRWNRSCRERPHPTTAAISDVRIAFASSTCPVPAGHRAAPLETPTPDRGRCSQRLRHVSIGVCAPLGEVGALRSGVAICKSPLFVPHRKSMLIRRPRDATSAPATRSTLLIHGPDDDGASRCKPTSGIARLRPPVSAARCSIFGPSEDGAPTGSRQNGNACRNRSHSAESPRFD